jgi:hypothetical protein
MKEETYYLKTTTNKEEMIMVEMKEEMKMIQVETETKAMEEMVEVRDLQNKRFDPYYLLTFNFPCGD